jgi:hypothetical protein
MAIYDKALSDVVIANRCHLAGLAGQWFEFQPRTSPDRRSPRRPSPDERRGRRARVGPPKAIIAAPATTPICADDEARGGVCQASLSLIDGRCKPRIRAALLAARRLCSSLYLWLARAAHDREEQPGPATPRPATPKPTLRAVPPVSAASGATFDGERRRSRGQRQRQGLVARRR